MKLFFTILIIIHGLIHLLGFVKGFKLADINQLTRDISGFGGVMWLITAVLFIITAVLLLINNEYWWVTAGIAVIISQILIIVFWSDAKFGTIANLIIIVPIIISFVNAQPSSFGSLYKAAVNSKIMQVRDTSLLTEDDIKQLPIPVQKYIKYTGAIGKPKVRNFRAVCTGQFMLKKGSKWVEFKSRQYNFYGDPARMFLIESQMYGVPIDGLHLYIGNSATMQIKIASIIKVADAKGKEMNKGETVTLFNDMCIMSPSSLIDKNIKWENIDSLTVKAVYSNKGNTISAILYFNTKGELVNFISDDRYLSSDGKTYLNYRWSTPIRNYKEINSRRIPTYAEAIWHMPEGEYCYGKFNVREIEYNCTEFQ